MTEYRFSNSNIWWKDANDKLINILNSISKCHIKIEESLFCELKNNKFRHLDEGLLKYLIDQYFILPNNFTEFDAFNAEQKIFYENTDRLNIFLVPSRKCNFRCSYCIQNNLFEQDKHLEMSEDVIDEYVIWLNKQIIEWDVKLINFVFYGGEPLTASLSTLNAIYSKFSKLPINTKFRLISNGYSIDKYIEFIDKIDDLTVTLDGNKENHNKRRTLFNGSPTYDYILANIKKYIQINSNKKLILRVNVDKDNRIGLLDQVKKLCNLFNKEIMEKRVRFQFTPTDPYLFGQKDSDIHSNIAETAKVIVECYRYTIQLGCIPFVYLSNCGVNTKSSYTFDTNGNIYVCPSHTGITSKAISSAKKSITCLSYDEYISKKNLSEKCIKCKFLGLCAGGCEYQREINGTYCRKEFYEILIPEIAELIKL